MHFTEEMLLHFCKNSHSVTDFSSSVTFYKPKYCTLKGKKKGSTTDRKQVRLGCLKAYKVACTDRKSTQFKVYKRGNTKVDLKPHLCFLATL